jgi:hypothetical protein
MNEEQFRTGHSCKRLDMGENGLISWAVLERNEDMFIHGKNDEIRMTNDEYNPKLEWRKTTNKSLAYSPAAARKQSAWGCRSKINLARARFELRILSFLRHSSLRLRDFIQASANR